MNVAVLGSGIMGAAAARSLLRAGLAVRVWNRTAAKAEPLTADGATVATSVQDAVRDADVVLVFVFDTDAVVDVLTEMRESVGDAVVLQASTIGVEGTRRAAETAAEHGITLVDAPVLGTKQPAEQGMLTILISGDAAAIERATPVLDAIGARTIRVGDRVGQASALKLVVNSWVGTLTAGLGQSIAFAEQLDVDPALFLEVLAGGATDTPYAHLKGASMIEHSYPTSFSVDGVVKDVGLMRAAAEEVGVDDTILAAVEQVFTTTASNGLGGDDMAAVREAF